MERPRLDVPTKLMVVMTVLWVFLAFFSIQSSKVQTILFWYTLFGALPWTLLVVRAISKYFQPEVHGK